MLFRNPNDRLFVGSDPDTHRFDVIRVRALCAYYAARTSMRRNGIDIAIGFTSPNGRSFAEEAYAKLQGIIAEYNEDTDDQATFDQTKQIHEICAARDLFRDTGERIETLPMPVRAQIYRLQRDHADGFDFLEQLELTLERLVELTSSLADRQPKGGRPANDSQTRLLQHIADFIALWTNLEIPKTFTMARGGQLPDGTVEMKHISPTAAVIFDTASSIEPELKTSQVKSALQGFESAREDSKNPPRKKYRFLD